MHRVSPRYPDIQVVDVNTSDPANFPATLRFQIQQLPTTMFFDGRGQLLTHFLGINVDEQLEELFQKHGYQPTGAAE